MIYVLDLFLLPAVHFLAAPCPKSKDCRAISYIKFRPSRTSVSDAASSCQSQNHGNWQARRTNLALARCSSGDSSAQSRGVNRARDRRSQSAATETSRLDRAPPYHCRASIPACCVSLRQAGAPVLQGFRARSASNWGDALRSRGKIFGSTESRPTKEVSPEVSLQINGPLEQR